MSKSTKQFLFALAAFWIISFMIFAPTANILFSLPQNARAADPSFIGPTMPTGTENQLSGPVAWGIGMGVCAVAKVTGMAIGSGVAMAQAALVPVNDTGGVIAKYGAIYTQLDQCAIETANNKIIKWVSEAISAAAKIALEQLLVAITNQIITYINSDEFGHKSFVLDFNAALNSAAQVAGAKFLNSLSGVNLCSVTPRLKLQMALLPIPEFKTQAECTLDKIVGNIEDFYADFSKGGWVAWNESMKPNNNAFGTWLMAQDKKAALEFAAIQKKDKEITNGFESKKRCLTPFKDANDDGKNDIDSASVDCATSITTTPSGTVEVATNFAALSPIRSLEGKIAAAYANTGVFGPFLSAITNALLNRFMSDGISALMKSVFTPDDLTQPNPYQDIINEVSANSGDFMTAQGNQAQANLILNTLKTFDQYITDTAGPLYFNLIATATNIQTEQNKIINDFWAQGITGSATVTILSGPTTTPGTGSVQQTTTTLYSVVHTQIGQSTIEKIMTTYTDGTTTTTFNSTNKKNQIEEIDGIFTKYNTTYNSLIYSRSQANLAQTPTQNAYDKITAYINTWNGTSGNIAAKTAMDTAVADALPEIQGVVPSTSTALDKLATEIVSFYNTTLKETSAETQNQTQDAYNNYLTAVKDIYNSLTGTSITL